MMMVICFASIAASANAAVCPTTAFRRQTQVYARQSGREYRAGVQQITLRTANVESLLQGKLETLCQYRWGYFGEKYIFLLILGWERVV
jgi:hypothetical protein